MAGAEETGQAGNQAIRPEYLQSIRNLLSTRAAAFVVLSQLNLTVPQALALGDTTIFRVVPDGAVEAAFDDADLADHVTAGGHAVLAFATEADARTFKRRLAELQAA